MIKKIIPIIILIIFNLSLYLIFLNTITKQDENIIEPINYNETNFQEIITNKLITKTYFISGNSMEPMFFEDDEIKVDLNYFKNKLPQKEDIILYNFSANINPIIKIIKATLNDNISINKNTLLINNKIMRNSQNTTYFFSEKEIKMLSLYINSENHLPKNAYLIFGDNTKNSHDSRKFGAIDISGFIGKVI